MATLFDGEFGAIMGKPSGERRAHQGAGSSETWDLDHCATDLAIRTDATVLA